MTSPASSLVAVKLVHTIVWAFFVVCIIGIPVASSQGHHTLAATLVGVVLLETLVLALNKWSCPLTKIAARYTEDRRPNFDIYLPEWLARHNKLIFGGLFGVGTIFALVRRMV